MDQIFNPNYRKWVSKPLKMGDCMEKVKHLVSLNKDDLVIIDPAPTIKAYMGMSHNPEEHDGESGNNNPPEFMRPTAMKIEDDILPDETEAEAGEPAKQTQDKWSESDSACEAAVSKVGGEDFFLFKKKKPNNRKGKRNKSKRSVEDLEDDEDEDEDEEDMELDYDDQGDTSKNQTDPLMDTRMYEKYNYDQAEADFDSNISFDDELKSLMAVTEAKERREISLMVPEALKESDDEEGDWLEDDDETENFAGDAQRYEALKQMIENGSDDSEEDEKAQYSTDEEQIDAVEQQSRTSPDDGQTPGPSKASRASAKTDRDTPLRSAMKKGGNRGKKDNKRVTICPEGENSPTASPSNLMSVTDIKREPMQEQQANTSATDSKDDSNAADIQDSTADFKRFTDWVFAQNSKRDKEYRKAFRPELMKKLNLNEEHVRVCQTLTSANLTSVKGEVFQDEPVMQSSSMPLLAPPTSVPARTTLQSLAIFLTHGEDPSVFPWKSINVQQQMNDDFVNHQFMKRMEQQKLDTINPLMKDLLVNKEDDFLVQVLIYQATDPEDVLPDEVKLRGRVGNEVEVIAAVSKPARRRNVADYSDVDGYGYGTPVLGANRYMEPKLAYEVNMLGSQTIKDLMKMFHCENDYVCLKDTSHPDSYKEDPSQYAKSKFPWSMILIDDTIYADPESEVDYISVINKWAKKPPEKCVGPFKRGDWNRQLKDVTLRFGYPYVFIHLGGCEHIFVFTKSRLLHVEDEHLLTSYPNIVGMTRFKNVYCRVDNEYLARWAVLDFKEFPENPMLLCTECVLMYCYDKNKKKRGDFKLYPFTQMANIL